MKEKKWYELGTYKQVLLIMGTITFFCSVACLITGKKALGVAGLSYCGLLAHMIWQHKD